MKYRQGANALVLDDKGNYLVVQKVSYDSHQWDFPGGGSEEGDTPEITVMRELKEELGSTEFEILYKSPIKIQYDWPKEAQEAGYRKHNKWFQGQEKTQFIVRFLGDKNDLNLQKEEIRQIKWIPYEQLKDHLVFEDQWENANKVIQDYKKQR